MNKDIPKILIVEDEFIVAKNLENKIAALGYEVVGIYSEGEEALKNIPKKKPDIILMDIMLAGKLNGIDAATQIQSEFNLPVIFLTAYSSREMLEKAKLAHPFGYILKPYGDRELEINISIALYRNEVEKELSYKEGELVKINNNLEKLVEERTKELQNSNKRLEKEIEEKVVAEEQLLKFHELFHASRNLIAISSHDGKELYLNPEARGLFGLDFDVKMDEVAIRDLVREIGLVGRLSAIREDLLANLVWVGELDLKALGKKVTVLATIVVHMDNSGEAANISIIAQDITREKQAIRKLAKAKEMEVSMEKRKQKIKSAALIQGQEEERRRVSKELHDGIGQLLATSKRRILNFRANEGASGGTNGLSFYDELVEEMDTAIDEIRRISSDLMPSVLEHFGLKASLQYLIRQYSVSKEITIQFESNVSEVEISEQLKIAFYRIAQEALNNATKYAESSRILVTLNYTRDILQLRIEDNGIGFNRKKVSAKNMRHLGKGLPNMKERIELLRGTFNIKSVIGKGTIVEVKKKLNTRKK